MKIKLNSIQPCHMDPLHGKVSVDVHMTFDCLAADDLDAIVQVAQWLDESQAVRQEKPREP